jgi:hypothetical protein
MTTELLSETWARFAERLRWDGYALLRIANPKLISER